MSARPEVSVQQGTVRGVDAGDVWVYRGIPFGASAAGDQRFRAPQPAEGWSGVRDADTFATKAIQPPPGLGGDPYWPESEDCLALNVWVPKTSGPHPVFVWVHGGSQKTGFTGGSMSDGARLAARGTIVVSVAYRLGAFGFLRLRHLLGDDYAGSENNALRDIALALQWVHDNIAAFGGDPGRITLAGESAGGKNVLNSLAVPQARQVIARAISQSGSGMTLMSTDIAEQVTAALLDQMGIAAGDAEQLLSADPQQIKEASELMAPVAAQFPWRGVVDGVVMLDEPMNLARQGVLNDIDIIVGTNADEYDLFAVTKGFDTAEPTIAQTAHLWSQHELDAMIAAYKKAFPDLSDIERRIRMMTAEEYWIPTIRMAEALVDGGASPRVFSFRWGPQDHPGGFRAAHAMELPFLFGTLDSPISGVLLGDGSAAPRALSETMQTLWSEFIATGAVSSTSWPSYADNRATLYIDEPVSLVHDPDREARELWDGVL